MRTITDHYAQLTEQAQVICDLFSYKEPLTACIMMGVHRHNGQPWVMLSAQFLGMSIAEEAELRAVGVACPPCLVISDLCADENEALAGLAQALNVANPFAPIAYATGEQKEQIKALLNHPCIDRAEKMKGLLNINRFTAAVADELIVGLKKDINARSQYTVFADVADEPQAVGAYAVVGEAYQVAAA